MTTAELALTEVGGPEPAMTQVSGPSALGGGWRRFVRLTWVIAKKDFKLTYFGSVLGYVWSLMQPLLFFGVLYLVFAVIVQFNKGVADFPVLLLMNIVLFSFFQAGTGSSITSVVVRENLVRKMHFPRLVIPLATVVTQSINLVFNLIVVLVFMVVYGARPRLTWLLLPVLVVGLLLLTAGIAMLLSALYVRYRDVAPIWGVISQALYFASPVFILIDSVLKHGRTVSRLYLFNPMALILQQARHWMIGGPGGGVSPATIMGGKLWLLAPIGIGAGLFVLGFFVFRREAPRIAEEL
jgi:ABC-2 type transport system permease protein